MRLVIYYTLTIFSLYTSYTIKLMSDDNKQTIIYGGGLILILVTIYLLRNVFHPIAESKKLYATLMDSMGGAAFNTYVTPDNFHRP